MNKSKIINIVALTVNSIIVILVFYAICSMLIGGITGNMTSGTETFRYFTNLSNILVGFMTMLIIPFNINSIISGKSEVPLWAILCQFIGTVAVSVTFLTCICFLGPMQGFSMIFAGPCLYLHGIIPILSIISTIFLSTEKKIPLKLVPLGLLSIFLYSIVYVITVVMLKVWPDFYGFTFGGKMWAVPISLVVMYLVTLGISYGLYFVQNSIHKKMDL